MPINWKQVDREEEEIQRAYANGEISNAEMWKQLRELQRDVGGAIEEEAEEAARYSREQNGQW